MVLRKLLERVSHKTLRRMCGAAIVISAMVGGQAWAWFYSHSLWEGRVYATYWFSADGSATCVLDIHAKNSGALPLREVQLYGSKPEPGDLVWYDQHGATLEWRSEPTDDANLWKQVAGLHTPAYRGEWLRYTVWWKHIKPRAVEHDGESWGTFQDEDGNWVFRNNPALRSENTVTLVLPEGAEVVSAEPANHAHVLNGACPAVEFTNLRGAHVVKWRMKK